MDLKLVYDPSADAALLRLSDKVAVDSEEVSPGFVLDFDEDGRLVALEVLLASKRLPEDALLAAVKFTI